MQQSRVDPGPRAPISCRKHTVTRKLTSRVDNNVVDTLSAQQKARKKSSEIKAGGSAKVDLTADVDDDDDDDDDFQLGLDGGYRENKFPYVPNKHKECVSKASGSTVVHLYLALMFKPLSTCEEALVECIVINAFARFLSLAIFWFPSTANKHLAEIIDTQTL